MGVKQNECIQQNVFCGDLHVCMFIHTHILHMRICINPIIHHYILNYNIYIMLMYMSKVSIKRLAFKDNLLGKTIKYY